MEFVKRLLLLVVALLLAFTAVGTIGVAIANEETEYQALELFTDVLSIVRKSYVEGTDTTELIYGAIRGMLVTLDPHSSFLSPEMYQDMKDDTHGEFGGLGIEITLRDGLLMVVSPIEDTPAFNAGIEAGDKIIKIDDRSTKDMELMEAVRLLRGPKGESIRITILRKELPEPKEFVIIRDIIKLLSVKSRMLTDGYGYVRLSQFQARTGSELKTHLHALRAEAAEQFKGLVLDLRNNPGGLLDQAVSVSDLFLAEGLIVYTEGREEGSRLRFQAQQAGTEPDYPLVVLINGGSASAAEIVAGALHDHERAVILGEQSFGKGSVQSIIPLGDRSALRLTTARYYTPSGISIQARGITPDIVVPPLVLNGQDDVRQMREKDLQNHFKPLENKQPLPKEVDKNAISDEDRSDYQLMRALDLLKGLEILNRRPSSAA